MYASSHLFEGVRIDVNTDGQLHSRSKWSFIEHHHVSSYPPFVSLSTCLFTCSKWYYIKVKWQEFIPSSSTESFHSLSFFIPKAFRIMMAHKNEINSFWKEIPFKVKLHFPGSENILKLNDGIIYMYVCVCIIYTPSWTNIINKIIWSFICQRKNFHSNVYFYSRCWNEIKRDRFSKMVSRVFTNRKLLNFSFLSKQ